MSINIASLLIGMVAWELISAYIRYHIAPKVMERRRNAEMKKANKKRDTYQQNQAV